MPQADCLSSRVLDIDEDLSGLQQVGTAGGGEPLYDFGDVLGAFAGADEQRVGRFDDDQVVNT